MTAPPAYPKLFHIVHVDRLPSIIQDGYLWSDVVARNRQVSGTTIGITDIKAYRLRRQLKSHRNLCVGACVPFYYCPRSVMLYVLHRGNHPKLTYRGGQVHIVHLVFDLHKVVNWANSRGKRWAITETNAGTAYFQDWNNLSALQNLDWKAINATDWQDPQIKAAKQAEFLVEECVPWKLVEEIGVISQTMYQKVKTLIAPASHRPPVQVRRDWYY